MQKEAVLQSPTLQFGAILCKKTRKSIKRYAKTQNKCTNTCAFKNITLSLQQKKKQKQLNPKTRKGTKIMKTTEINNSIIGKRVNGIFLATPITGTITEIVEDYCPVTKVLCGKGVKIELDEPLHDGNDVYTSYESTARVYDDWGNLEYTKIMN